MPWLVGVVCVGTGGNQGAISCYIVLWPQIFGLPFCSLLGFVGCSQTELGTFSLSGITALVSTIQRFGTWCCCVCCGLFGVNAINALSKMWSIQPLSLLSFSLVYYLIGLGLGALLLCIPLLIL